MAGYGNCRDAVKYDDVLLYLSKGSNETEMKKTRYWILPTGI